MIDDAVRLTSEPGAVGARVMILSPWGSAGGYSGPLTFLNRLYDGIRAERPSLHITLLHRNRGNDERPGWADRAVCGLRSAGFGRLAQVRWMLSASLWVLAHRNKVDVVHAHGTYLTNLVPALFAKKGQVVLMPVLQDGDLQGLHRRGLKRWVAIQVARDARAGLALSDGIMAELKDIGIAPGRVRRISNPVDARMLDIERRTPEPGEVVRIGFVGKVGPLKNPHLLIEGCALLTARGTQCEVHYFGPFSSPQVGQSLTALAHGFGLGERVHFHGFTSDVGAAFQKFDIFVLPSVREGLPGSLMEAFATATPVVVTEAGSMAEYVRGADAGLVIKPEPAALADAVTQLSVREAWASAGTAARSFATEHLSPRVVARRYLEQVGI